MLTEDQKGVIERLSTQSELAFMQGSSAMDFTLEEIAEAVDASFEGKIPPAYKSVKIMVGPPGVGKTFTARNLFNQMPADEKSGTVYIAYNEGGAQNNFDPFMRDLSEAETREDKLAVTKQYQPVINKITNNVFKKALEQEYSMIIDISGIGADACDLMDTLRRLGYQNITVSAVHASFPIARSRAEERLWPTDPINIVSRRTNAFECLKDQAAKADHFDFYVNNYAIIDARRSFSLRQGVTPVVFEPDLLKMTCDDLSEDIRDVKEHLKHLRSEPAYKKKVDVDGLVRAYTNASNGLLNFLQDVRRNGEVLQETPRWGLNF